MRVASTRGWRDDPRRYLAGLRAPAYRYWGAIVVALVCWGAVWFARSSRRGGHSWHFFRHSAHALFDSGGPGLHLYATDPQWQFGPVSIVVSALIVGLAGVHSTGFAEFVIVSSGVLAVLMLLRTASGQGPFEFRDRRNVLVLGCVALIPAWMDLAAATAHLDDALAMLFTVGGILLILRDQSTLAAVSLALAAGAKPWALPVAVLLLSVDRPRRFVALMAYAATSLLCWLPFVLADHRTLEAGRFVIPIQSGSLLATLGLTGGTPAWDRPAQLLLGAALGWWAVRRGAWAAVPLLVILARLLLDPGAHSYYAASAVLAALSLDLLAGGRRWPLVTLATTAVLWLGPSLRAPGAVRGIGITVLLAATLLRIAHRPGPVADPNAQRDRADPAHVDAAPGSLR